MRWEKRGVIFNATGQHDWMAHHACVPVPDLVGEDVLRIYFSPRDAQGQSHAAFIEVEADNPSNVLYVHDEPLLSPGKLGTFDDSGVMPTCIVNHGGRKYMYYVGWNRSVTVNYRNSIGLAVSDDGGLTFERMFEGPVFDRNRNEPYFCASPFVMVDDDGKWKLWYGGTTEFVTINGSSEPIYQVKYAESADGVDWVRNNSVCLPYSFEGEANARPMVIKENGVYKMWYCVRGSVDYRTNKETAYRLGYAESPDGIDWTRKNEELGIERSEEGWDSLMMEYPHVWEHKGRKHLFYNGNGFGETGFGYAVEADE